MEDLKTPLKRSRATWFIIGASVLFAVFVIASAIHQSNLKPDADAAPPAQASPTPDQNALAANDQKPDPCAPLIQRAGDIDNGASYGGQEPGGTIRPVTFKTAGDYHELKDCWRSERIGKDNPGFSYGGLSGGSSSMYPLTLGMTMQQAVDALPVVTDLNAHGMGWIQEGCTYPDPSPSRNVKMSCMVSQPATRFMVGQYGAASQDNLTLDFDGTGTDAKLLGLDLITSVPVESYKTTDAVIRYERENSSLDGLGPPDVADGKSATWSFSTTDLRRTLLRVSLTVTRHNGVFQTELEADDLEHEDNDIRPQPGS